MAMTEKEFSPVTPGEILKDEFLTELTSRRIISLSAGKVLDG
jgi:plasmid maintenance system antidote protein VapI